MGINFISRALAICLSVSLSIHSGNARLAGLNGPEEPTVQPWHRELLTVKHVNFEQHSHHHGTVLVRWINQQGQELQIEQLVHRVRGIYTPDAKVETSDGSLSMINSTDALFSFHAKEAHHWLVVTKDPLHETRVSIAYHKYGEPVLEFMHHSEVRHDMGDATFRRLQGDIEPEEDAYFGLVHDFMEPPINNGESDEEIDPEVDRPRKLDTSSVSNTPFTLRDINVDPYRDELAFFPFCYPFDTRRQTIDLGLAATRATWENEKKSLTTVQSKFESYIARTSLIFEAQLNINFRIRREMFAGSTVPSDWHEVFHFSVEQETCPFPYKLIRETMFAFARSVTVEENAATWVFVHGCPSDGHGFAATGSVCRDPSKGGSACQTASMSWRTMAHEIGHAVGGMDHTFQNGQKETGGLMDYGGGKIRGTNRYAYSILTRDKSCFRLTNAYESRIPKCPYWRNATGDLACGDRFLLPEEECECADGSTSCTGCVECKLTHTSQECSVSTFFMHPKNSLADGNPLIEGGSFSSPECCSSATGVLESVTTPCTTAEGTEGRCNFGRCLDTCAAYGMSICGVEGGGCMQECKPSGGQCRADYYRKNAKTYIGEVDNGSKCMRSSDTEGWCVAGECVATTAPLGSTRSVIESGQIRTKVPTAQPTPYPTTPQPTFFPTNQPTAPTPAPVPTSFPTKFPTTPRPTKAPKTPKPTKTPTPKPTKEPTTPRPTKAPKTPKPTPQPTNFPTKSPTTKCDATCEERQGTGSRKWRKMRCLDETLQGTPCVCEFADNICREATT